MKQFFEKYGGVALGILAILVLIAMITPVGNIIKTSLQGTSKKFASSINGQMDDAMNATAAAQEDAKLQSKNPYRKKVISVQTLYDVGEQNLTDDDIVTINGIDCYVLERTDNKAKLITKNIYKAYFDDGGHTSEEVDGHVGTKDGFTDKTYDYKYSTLKAWMDDFYTNALNSDSRIIDTPTNSYVSDISTTVLSAYNRDTIVQKVFALDAQEAKTNASKFQWSYSTTHLKKTDGSSLSEAAFEFWVSAGYRVFSGKSYAWFACWDGSFQYHQVNVPGAGARPVFWITLE